MTWRELKNNDSFWILLKTAKCNWTLMSENLIRKTSEKQWKPEYFPPKLQNRRVCPLTTPICYFPRSLRQCQKEGRGEKGKGIHIGKEKIKWSLSVSIFPSILTMIIPRFCIKSFICLSTMSNILLAVSIIFRYFSWFGIDFF